MRLVVPFAGQAFVGQTIVSWAIGGATSIKEIALKKNNSSIGEKPPNPVGPKEENWYKKSQVHLAFLFLVVNQSTIAAKGA